MTDEARSILLGTSPVMAVFATAAILTVRRTFSDPRRRPVENALSVGLVALSVQTVHFLEEYLFEFNVHYPDLLGLAAWPARFFVTFNGLLTCIWAIALVGLQYRVRFALWPLWGLGVALAANAVAHTALSFVARGYFPGLFTVPLVGVAGILLLRELTNITQNTSTPPERLDERYWNA